MHCDNPQCVDPHIRGLDQPISLYFEIFWCQIWKWQTLPLQQDLYIFSVFHHFCDISMKRLFLNCDNIFRIVKTQLLTVILTYPAFSMHMCFLSQLTGLFWLHPIFWYNMNGLNHYPPTPMSETTNASQVTLSKLVVPLRNFRME